MTAMERVNCTMRMQFTSWVTIIPRFLLFFALVLRTQSYPEDLTNRAKEEMPDMFQDATQTIRSHGYPVETHQVVTKDGYVVTIHRIPHGHNDVRDKGNSRKIALLYHGLFGGTDSWVVGGPGIAPAYAIADSGYDVWMGNARGNFYSREHVNMTDKNPNFWRFSWHEIGTYDVPAVYDYILNITGKENLTYVGHSMGNNIFYVMLSSQPDYNTKTRLHVALAPAVFWDGVDSLVAQILRNNHNLIKIIMDTQNTYELLSPSVSRNALYYFACRKNSTQRKLCAGLYAAVVGNPQGQSARKLPLYLARMMQTTSGLVMIHLAQNAQSGRFQQFDYGTKGNLVRYNYTLPPEYDLKKSKTPVVMYTSEGDDLVPAQGVLRLSKEVSNLIELVNVSDKFFNHLDFMVHQNVHELLLNHMLKTMAKY